MNYSLSFRPLLVVLLAGGALSACVIAPPPHREVYSSYPGGDAEMQANLPPPAPYVEVIPVMPFVGAVWIGGYWGWAGSRHHWVPGRWEAPHPGYRWQPHRWERRPGGHWALHGGVWVR